MEPIDHILINRCVMLDLRAASSIADHAGSRTGPVHTRRSGAATVAAGGPGGAASKATEGSVCCCGLHQCAGAGLQGGARGLRRLPETDGSEKMSFGLREAAAAMGSCSAQRSGLPHTGSRPHPLARPSHPSSLNGGTCDPIRKRLHFPLLSPRGEF